MRQCWRDLNSLLKWTRSEPHRIWWQNFLHDSGGTGFWHETYLKKGGMEAIYDDVAADIGLLRFAPTHEARGPMFGSAQRMDRAHSGEPVVNERDFYPE